MSWTDERVELLKKMWEEGISASQIAAQLGSVTRNAVIGKVHRLKISRLDKNAPENDSQQPLPANDMTDSHQPTKTATPPKGADKDPITTPQKAEKKSASAATMPKAVVKEKIPQENLAATIKDSKTSDYAPPEAERQAEQVEAVINSDNDVHDKESDVVVPISRRLSLLQLTEHTCKWPIGDPLGPGFYFCGAKTSEGSPYCSYHSKIAFQPMAERRRIKA